MKPSRVGGTNTNRRALTPALLVLLAQAYIILYECLWLGQCVRGTRQMGVYGSGVERGILVHAILLPRIALQGTLCSTGKCLSPFQMRISSERLEWIGLSSMRASSLITPSGNRHVRRLLGAPTHGCHARLTRRAAWSHAARRCVTTAFHSPDPSACGQSQS
jgi:hypothetical protein